MTVKEYLRLIPKYSMLIEAKSHQVAEIESRLVYNGVAQGDGGYFGSADTNRRNKALANWLNLKDELINQINELANLKRKGIKMIDTLTDPKQISVFYQRYLENKKWCDIAKDMNVSMQWVHELHKRGLKKIRRKFPEFD